MLRTFFLSVGVFCSLHFFALPTCSQQPAAEKNSGASAKPAPAKQPQVPAAPAPTPASSPAPKITPPPPPHALDKIDLEAFFDGIIPLQLQRSDVAGATVLVMKDGQTLLKKGYGYSDFKGKKPVDPDTTIFRLASVSKLFTWVSVMQLAEQGKLDIDTDVNKYLDFQIAPAFNKPITLRNLMTHTGGFEEEIRDIIFTDTKLVQPLRDFLIQNQPHRIFPPGEISAYSNYGVGLAGYIVQRVSGQPFEQYVAEHIFLPLSMTHSSFHQPLQNELAPLASDGYRSNTEKPAIGFEIFNPAPAGGIASSAADMGRFAQALINGGELDGHHILKPETLATMWTRQFAASDALPAMCMGFYQTWRNGLHFIGHDGDLIAFHSRFLLEPKEKLAIFISYNSAGSANSSRSEILNDFADRYYPYVSPSQSTGGQNADAAKAFAGTFQPTRRSESNKLKIGSLTEQIHVTVDKEGVVTIDSAKDLRGHTRKWKPVGADLWQATDDQPLLFAIRNSGGEIVRYASSFAGSQYERVPWYENAKWIVPALGVSLGIVSLVVLATLVRLGRKLFFGKRAQFRPQPGTLWLTIGPRLASFAWLILCVALLIIMSSLQNETTLPTRHIDRSFVLFNFLAAIAIFFSLFAIGSGLLIWRRAGIRAITQVKFSFVAAACLFLAWFSIHWHILGPAHRF